MGFMIDTLTQERLDVQREVVKNERRQSYENRPLAWNGWCSSGRGRKRTLLQQPPPESRLAQFWPN